MLEKPKSSVNVMTGIVGTIAFIVTVLWVRFVIPGLDIYTDCLLILTFTALSMVFYDIVVVKEYLSSDNGLEWTSYAKKFKNSFFKLDFYFRLLGFLFSLLFLYAFYPLLDLHGEFIDPFFHFLKLNAFLFFGVTFLYLVLIYPALKVSRDGLWALGALVNPRLWSVIDKAELKNYLLSLAIKIFFLPLMFVYFFKSWSAIKFGQFVFDDVHHMFSLAFNSLFLLDLGFAVVGYAFSLRLLNSHIRWPEKQFFGWFFCLICYFPFNAFFFDKFLNYHDGLEWTDWIGDYPVIYVAWGILILVGHIIYVAATVNFGLRFSNLTHRGIITHGAYAYTKHPAYLSKNIAWWLMEVPFIATSFVLAIKNMVLILLVNLVYYARAKLEERTLLPDENYQNYTEYISEYGIISKIKRVLMKL